MDDHQKEAKSSQQAGLSKLIYKLYQPGPLIVFFTLCIVALSVLGYFILVASPSAPAPSHLLESKMYEEENSTEMEDTVKQVDLAILATIRKLKLDMKQLDLLDVEIHHKNGRTFHYQTLQIPPSHTPDAFFQSLTSLLLLEVPDAVTIKTSSNEILIRIQNDISHRLLLAPTEVPSITSSQSPPPQLAIVIDDIGENISILRQLASLNIPLTLAVWPHASHTQESINIISNSGKDLIIHFPMEPRKYPRYNPGDDALFISMTKKQLLDQIQDNLSQIPNAIGVNNHMGSRFTEDEAGMLIALSEFKKHGLFFLDSLTTSKSVARKCSREVGIKFYERDVFIDNVKDSSAILLQLKKAEKVAKKQGHAIAIGHPYKATLTALKQWLSSKSTEIRLISISQMPQQ